MKAWHDALSTLAISFTHKPTTHDTSLCELSELALLRVSGADAQDFLQNQFTNDLRLLTANNSQISAWCTPKGRILVTFRIYKHADAIYLCLARDLVETIFKRLQMYVFRSNVKLENISEQRVLLSLAGAEATKILEAQTMNPPTEDNAVTHIDDENSIIRLPSPSTHYMLLLNPEKAATLLTSSRAEAKACASNHWDYLNIMSHIPNISAVTTETWTPQMISYELVGGVNFKKGCYPGQEVVARTHYLGKAKRRLARVDITSSEAVNPKTNIVDNDGKTQGQIVNAASNPQGTISALAVLRTDSDDTLHLKDDQNAVVSVQKRIV